MSAAAEQPTAGGEVPLIDLPPLPPGRGTILVILGATGNLAMTRIWPSLWDLFLKGKLPSTLDIVAFSHAQLDGLKDFRPLVRGHLSKDKTGRYVYWDLDRRTLERFWRRCCFVRGLCHPSKPDYQALKEKLERLGHEYEECDHYFYLALPNDVRATAITMIKKYWASPKGRNRVIVEKPFGVDEKTSTELEDMLAAHFEEEEDVFRLDHNLSQGIVESVLALRFGNRFFSDLWNREHLSGVIITFYEKYGSEVVYKGFDQVGIVVDAVQVNLIQLMALVAMEEPASLSEDDVRAEKLRLLGSTRPPAMKDTVVGQYIRVRDSKESELRRAYYDHSWVAEYSKTPTYASVVFHIDNDRWEGVPFLIRCGKGMAESRHDVRLQFREEAPPKEGLGLQKGQPPRRNELVFSLEPQERLVMRLNNTLPSLEPSSECSMVDVNYASKNGPSLGLSNYQKALLGLLADGETKHLIGKSELKASWAVMRPLLSALADSKSTPLPYFHGSHSGPEEADRMAVERYNFVLDG